jgi:ribosomal protein S18 acetylase RimI-like enzyme
MILSGSAQSAEKELEATILRLPGTKRLKPYLREYNKSMIPLSEKQVGAASQALALAFQHDPLFLNFFPAAATRLQFMGRVFALQLRQGLLVAGSFSTSPALEGLLILLPSEKINLDFWSLLKSGAGSLLLHLPPHILLRMLRVEKALTALRQRNTPPKYAYIPLLGVHPDQQGRGHAGRLLKNLLGRLDAGQMPCYLETENPKNVPLYEAFGFHLAETAELPGHVPCWAMLRD